MSGGNEPPRPRRVVVTHPRTAAARARGQAPRPVANGALAEQGEVAQVLVRALVRAQLVLAARVLVAVACPLGALPLLFALSPGLREVSVLGVGLVWLLLGVTVYPTLVVVGWLYVRVAERNEREFAEVVERS